MGSSRTERSASGKGLRTRGLRSLPLVSIASVVIVIAVWALVSGFGIVDRILLPSPSEVVKALVQLATRGYGGSTLWENLLSSLIRLFFGFVLAVLVGVPLGLAMGISRLFKGFVDPIMEFYRPLPALAYYTLIVIWLGTGDPSKVAVLFLAALPPIVLSTTDAVRGVNQTRIRGVESLGLDRRAVIRQVIFPSCLPDIFGGVRIGFGYAFSTLVAAELIASTSGLGWLVMQAGQFAQMSMVIVGIAILGFIAFAVDLVIGRVQRWAVPWHGRS